ncbi:MAG: hypothetical protein C5B60_09915 [Chloroflexi bacterium]|nr:MAG: hypothetical protein C5B60_09915 [Chloroflexota bacterium]
MTELQELFAHAAQHAAIIFREKGELVPMFHAVLGNDQHALIAAPWSDAEEKGKTIYVLRDLFRKKKVKRYVFIAEAWTVMAPSLEQVGDYIGRMSEHPDRREVVTISAEDRDGTNMMGYYFILRPEHSPATLSPLHMSKATEAIGQLMGMLR